MLTVHEFFFFFTRETIRPLDRHRSSFVLLLLFLRRVKPKIAVSLGWFCYRGLGGA